MSLPRINSARLARTLEDLGRIGETPQGMQRLAFSPADVAGREYTIKLMHQAGLETRIDPAGNIIGRKEGPGRDCRLSPWAPTLTPFLTGANSTALWVSWALLKCSTR